MTKVDAEYRKSSDLIRDLTALEGGRCTECARPLCGHQNLMSLVMGFKNAPRCGTCLAAGLDQPPEELRDRLFDLIHHRDCYRSGWRWANRGERVPASARPPCLWPAAGTGTKARKPGAGKAPSSAAAAFDAEWDAGDMGCGDLVLELRLRLGRMKPGEALQLTARDPGAPEDVPAWCRLTGNALVTANHPVYVIRRKEA